MLFWAIIRPSHRSSMLIWPFGSSYGAVFLEIPSNTSEPRNVCALLRGAKGEISRTGRKLIRQRKEGLRSANHEEIRAALFSGQITDTHHRCTEVPRELPFFVNVRCDRIIVAENPKYINNGVKHIANSVWKVSEISFCTLPSALHLLLHHLPFSVFSSANPQRRQLLHAWFALGLVALPVPASRSNNQQMSDVLFALRSRAHPVYRMWQVGTMEKSPLPSPAWPKNPQRNSA